MHANDRYVASSVPYAIYVDAATILAMGAYLHGGACLCDSCA
jgi:hypothetical protein